jgi:PAS domain S-box-containing protein
MDENDLFEILDRLPEPRLVLDDTGTILRANEAGRELLGHGGVELEGNALSNIPFPGKSHDWEAKCRMATEKAATGETVRFMACLASPALDSRHLEFQLVAIPHMRNRILTIIRDITSHQRLHLQLLKDERLLSAITNTAPVFIVALDRHARILLMNEPMRLALGYAGSDDLQGKDYISAVVPPEEREQVKSTLARAFDPDRRVESEPLLTLRKVAGRLMEWHFSLVQDETDGEKYSLIVGIDVTRRREAESLAEEREQRLAQAMRLVSLGTLVSGFAHELNNPNNFIRLSAQNLASFWSEIASVLERVASSPEGLSLRGIPYSRVRELVGKMINGIIDGSDRISRLEADVKAFALQGHPTVSGRADVNSSIAASLRILDNLIQSSTDRFSVEYGAGLPLVPVYHHHLEVVVGNIVANACQALTDTHQRISLSTTRDNDGWVAIRVTDEGEGILPENLAHIFDPFFSTKRDRGGLGIGLSVSSDIIRYVGGTITCRSIIGAGTEMLVRLPPAEVSK